MLLTLKIINMKIITQTKKCHATSINTYLTSIIIQPVDKYFVLN